MVALMIIARLTVPHIVILVAVRMTADFLGLPGRHVAISPAGLLALVPARRARRCAVVVTVVIVKFAPMIAMIVATVSVRLAFLVLVTLFAMRFFCVGGGGYECQTKRSEEQLFHKDSFGRMAILAAW